MRLSLLALGCALVSLLSPGWVLSMADAADYVYYVDPSNGTLGGDGSALSPFVNIEEALVNVTDVDSLTIYLLPGDYRGDGNIGLTYSASTVMLVGSGSSGANESAIDCRGTGTGIIVTSADFTASNLSIGTCQTAAVVDEFALATLSNVAIRDIPGTAVILQDAYLFICENCEFSNVRNNSISGSVYTAGLLNCQLSGPPGVGSVGGGIDLSLYFTGSVSDCTFSEVVGLIGSTLSTQALKLNGGIWDVDGCLFDGCALRLNPDSPKQEVSGLSATDVTSLGGTILFQDPGSQGSLTVTNSSFIDGFSYGDGGALAVANGATVEVENILFDGNRATNGGAVFVGSNTTITMVNSVLSFNEASEDGGGMFVQSNGVAYLDGCIFNFNSATVNASDLACCTNSTDDCSASVYSTNTTVILDDDRTTCTIEEWQTATADQGEDDGDDGDSGFEWYDITLIVLSAIGVVAVLVGLLGFVVAFVLYKQRMRKAYEVVDE